MTVPKISVVAAEKVPARVVGAGATVQLAAYHAKQAAERLTASAPLVASLLEGKSLSGTADTAEQAGRDAANVKRLVTPGLVAAGKAASITTSGSTWYILAVAPKPKKAVAAVK